MSRRPFLLSRAVVLGLLAGSADAGTLTSATWTELLPGGYVLTRTSGQLGATGTSTANSIAVNLGFSLVNVGFFLPKTATPGVHQHFSITQGGSQALTANPSMAGATMGVPGSVSVHTAVHQSKGVNQSKFS